jgi:3-oxoacyl-[acyl-carrier protein] reductase
MANATQTGNIRFDFHGKGVLITGGAQGIGFQMVSDFLKAGAQVMIWDYSQEALQAAQNELAKNAEFKGRFFTTQVDVSKMDSCAAAAAKLPFKLDVLVNNAGITRDKSFTKMSHEEWDSVISTNLTGVFNVTKSVFETFNPDSGNKRIINIASIVALYGNFGQTNYVATKAGVIGMTKTWAREFGKKGFTVNAIAPGFIQTAMTQKMPKEVLDAMVAKIPAGRMGITADIANAALFLASSEASYINGTTISVDGALVS